MSFSIKGTGHALPDKKVTNHDLSLLIDTSDEWIVSKTGIRQRHILTTESITELAVRAATLALIDAGITADSVDMVIVATMNGDTVSPSTACLIASALNIKKPSFDINAACTGFIYALDVAAGFFARKRVKTVLIVCCEQMSRHLDWTDRATCVLFGDGAAAVVLTEGEDLLSIKLDAVPGDEFIRIPFVGGDSPFNKREKDKPYLYMNGQEVYKFAISSAAVDIDYALAQCGLSKQDLSFVLLHQANMRIINAIKDKMSLSSDKVLTCIEQTGNISSASLPVLLDKGNREGKFNNGDLIALSAFGGGLTSGAAIIRWSK